MNFLGDYFAFGLVIVLCMFFFDGKHALNKVSRYFVICLLLTGATALIDILAGALNTPKTPLWLNMTVNSLYFTVNILTTSSIAMYLFNKILEHSHAKKCLRYATIGVIATISVYMFVVIANIWTGWMFYFDESLIYCRGPMNSFGYIITIVQMLLVMVCYLRNRKNATLTMRRALSQTFPVIMLCILIQRLYPEIMLNSFIMSMMNCVLFLTFNGQRPGVHALTKLNDRHRFFEDLTMRMKAKKEFQIFMINIKNFGTINQKYGHMFGDELLYQFAFSLEKLIKGSESFHMSGTVFAIVMPYVNHHIAERHRSTLLEFLEGGVLCEGDPFYLDYVAVEYASDKECNSAEEFYELLEYAAAKAYKSKLPYFRCTPDIGKEMLRKRYLIDRMQKVDREHGFQVWYQPIKTLSTGCYCSMEALIRMVEPDGTVVSPAEFIPLAEQAGMIAPFTWFVLEEVCRMMRDNPILDGVSVGINMPMSQMLDKTAIVRVNSIVDSYGIAHDRIGLEFTEREILENFAAVKHSMSQFTRAGYNFYLDDFGAGYSNFNCLLQLPFQNVKLDMNLIQMDIRDDGTQQIGLIKTLTGFLHDMDLTVIAEGVETTEVANVLRSMDMDRIQGYIYAKPMPEEKLLEFYEKI